MVQLDKEVNEDEMTVEEFKAYCSKFDANITEIVSKDRFKVQCQKCKSFEVSILHNGKVISQGSEYTGCWTSQDFNLVFKCLKCGNAIGLKEGR